MKCLAVYQSTNFRVQRSKSIVDLYTGTEKKTTNLVNFGNFYSNVINNEVNVSRSLQHVHFY